MKKIFCIFLCIYIFVFSPLNVLAATAQPNIDVFGGAEAAGGIAGGTNAKGDVVAILAGLALASQGISISIASDDSITPLDFIIENLKEYAQAVGITFQELCDSWLDNVKLLVDGTFTLGLNNSKKIMEWIAYLISDDSIMHPANNGTVIKLGDVNCPVLMQGDTLDFIQESNGIKSIKNTSNVPFGICYTLQQNVASFYLIAKNQLFEFQIFLNGHYTLSRAESGTNQKGIYIYKFYDSSFLSDIYVPLVNDFFQKIDDLNGDLVFSLDMEDITTFVGDTSDINLNDFDPSTGNVNTLDPGLDLSGLASSYDISGNLTISNYLEAIKRAINGLDNNYISVNDSNTNVLRDIPISFDPFTSTTLSQDSESILNDGQNVIDENQYPSGEQAEQYLNNMQFDLTGIFPFCLPFDVYNLLSKLDVEPVTPNVHLSFSILNEPYVLDLDFSQWDGIASVVRKMELLAFVVGLALITRNLIRG